MPLILGEKRQEKKGKKILIKRVEMVNQVEDRLVCHSRRGNVETPQM
jgi:hypothetical protein